MNNRILLKTIGGASDTNFDTIAKLMIAANDISHSTNGAAFDQTLVFDVFYVPSDVAVSTQPVTGELVAYTPSWISKRQDLKTTRIQQLPKAVQGKGVVVRETTEGQFENYFENSYVMQIDGAWFRLGISNFTQSEDNNPYSAVTNILYFEV